MKIDADLTKSHDGTWTEQNSLRSKCCQRHRYWYKYPNNKQNNIPNT